MTLITQQFVNQWVPRFPGLAIKYENRNFIPEPNQPWVGFFIRSGRVAEAAISAIMPRGIGIVYLQIFLPENTGTLIARQYADAFADVFDNWHATYSASSEYPQGDFWFKRVEVVMLPQKEGWLQWNCSVEFKHDEQVVTQTLGGGGGLPPGGTAAQVLEKVDATDYNAKWVTLPLPIATEPFTIPAVGATASVSVALATDILPNMEVVITDGINFLNGRVVSVPTGPFSAFASAPIAGQTTGDVREFGIWFYVTSSGAQVTAAKYYRFVGGPTGNVADLWDVNGNLLASVTFAGETASGWQTQNFATPVSLLPNTYYCISYHGSAASCQNFITADVVNGPLVIPSSPNAVAAGVSGNGVYCASGVGFPSGAVPQFWPFIDVVVALVGTATIIVQNNGKGGATSGTMGVGRLSVSGNAAADSQVKPISWLAGTTPNNATIFIADRALTITSAVGVVEVANGAAATITIVKAASGVALSAGTVIHSGSFDANGAEAINQALTLTVTAMAAGDRLGLITTGTFTNSVGSLSVFVQ